MKSRETIHIASVLVVVVIGLVIASIASATSAHAQANNTSSSSAAANNMTSTAAGIAGNITKVIVTMEVKEGKKQEALNTLIPLAELGRKKQGNISYDIYSSIDNPNELVLDQLWSNKAAFDKHYNSPEASKSRQTVESLVVKPAQVKIYAEVGKIQP